VKKAIVFFFALLIAGCSEKEPQVVSIKHLEEYVQDWGSGDLQRFKAEEGETVVQIDVITRKKYSYDYPPSYILADESFNIDSTMTGSETWVHLRRDYDESLEIIMEKDWTDADLESSKKSKYIRLIFVIDKNVKEGFLNMRGHKSVKLSFERYSNNHRLWHQRNFVATKYRLDDLISQCNELLASCTAMMHQHQCLMLMDPHTLS